MMKTKWLRLILIMLILWIHPGIAAWAQAEKATAFVHVNLVPMTDEKILLDQTVIIKDSRIIAIGPTKEVEIPDNSIVIDGSNFYLMPGLADMHIHTYGHPVVKWRLAGFSFGPFPCQRGDNHQRFRSPGSTAGFCASLAERNKQRKIARADHICRRPHSLWPGG
jgi:hypothetical protein